MRVHQQGSGALRPLVVAYHVSGAALRDKVSPRTTIASYVGTPFTGAYRTTSAANPTLDDLVQQLGAQLGAEAFWPIVLVGFSEGCQGIRHQLRQKLYPAATVAIDGVHASEPPAPWQLDVWREWFARCGADLADPREQCEPIEGKPIAIQTFTQIPTFGYMSTSDTAKAITGWDWPAPGGPAEPAILCSGNVWVHSFPGGDAAAHVDQGTRVLPAAVEGLARELGMGPDSPAPPQAPPPDQPPPEPGDDPAPLASVARRVLPAVALAGALALAAIEAEDHG